MVASKLPLDSVLSQIGIGWFHLRLWWICGLGFSAAAVEVVLMAFVFPELRRAPWELNEWELGRLAMVISAGSIFGETIFGYVADRYGRRNVFMGTVLIVVFFGIASAFAPSIGTLGALRFCVGFGYGGNIAVDFTLYSEFLPTEGRGKMLFMLTAFWPLGQVFACLLAWALVPTMGWRYFVAACAIPSVATALLRPLIPESPRWLLTQGRVEEATQICREIAECNGISAESLGLGDGCEVCLENEISMLANQRTEADTREDCMTNRGLFSEPFLRTTVGLLVIVSALNYCSYGILTLMPTFLEMKGIPRGSMYSTMLFNALAQLPGVLLAAWVATHIGRLAPFRVFIFCTGFCLWGFAMVSRTMEVTVCTAFASCFLEAGWALYHVYVPEVYPTECRAFATGFLSAAGSVVAMIGPMVSAALLESHTPFKAIMVFCSVAIFAGFAATFLLHIETKDRDLTDVSKAALKMI